MTMRIALFLVPLLWVAQAGAQSYPDKPVRLIVPFTTGSAADTLARIPAQKVSEMWGQQIVVDNRTGANGTIGADTAAKAAPDGYTLLLANDGQLATSPALNPKLPYNPLRDFAPIALAASIHVILITHPSLPVTSVKELIAYAKTRPGQIHYATSGNGSAQHMPMEMLKLAAGIDLVHVPYKGLGPALNDVIGGQVPVMFAGMSGALPHVKAGKIRALAIAASKRSPGLPDLPTVEEAGVPGFHYAAWAGFLAPAGTPAALIEKLNADFTKALNMPDVREKLTGLGFDVTPSKPAEFGDLIKREMAKTAKLVKDSGMKAD
jgi:tripartite-type tricarboxylate transporter receptor subunit TctC